MSDSAPSSSESASTAQPAGEAKLSILDSLAAIHIDVTLPDSKLTGCVCTEIMSQMHAPMTANRFLGPRAVAAKQLLVVDISGSMEVRMRSFEHSLPFFASAHTFF